MEQKNKQIEKLLSLEDDKLKAMINEIASATGANPKKVNELVKDIPSLKGQIARMSDSDVEKLISTVGKERAEQIMKDIEG